MSETKVVSKTPYLDQFREVLGDDARAPLEITPEEDANLGRVLRALLRRDPGLFERVKIVNDGNVVGALVSADDLKILEEFDEREDAVDVAALAGIDRTPVETLDEVLQRQAREDGS